MSVDQSVDGRMRISLLNNKSEKYFRLKSGFPLSIFGLLRRIDLHSKS